MGGLKRNNQTFRCSTDGLGASLDSCCRLQSLHLYPGGSHHSKKGIETATKERQSHGGTNQSLLWTLVSGSICVKRRSDPRSEYRTASNKLATATAGASAAATAAAFTRLVAVPAKDRTIATRLKRHCCRLAATRTNHRCSLCWSRTVAGAPLIVFLCLTAILATLWGRITTFLEERLIS